MLGTNCRSQLRDGLVSLDLSQLKPEDSGVYKLIARNQSGEISCSCRLMVYEVVKEDLVAPFFTMPIKGKSLHFVILLFNLVNVVISISTLVHSITKGK